MSDRNYVLITPARNEEVTIETTIQSVTRQTVPPKRWIIVSDGSTDRTDEIIEFYAKAHGFIHYQRRDNGGQRDFSSKVHTFNMGYRALDGVEYSYIGNLDADISLDPFYYERVLARFESNQRLGIAGGLRYDLYRGRFEKVICARDSVGGPIQLFRRKCFEDVGGFIPLETGGEDAVAEIMARMCGWEVQTFPELKVYHHRSTGTASANILLARFRDGMRNYAIGYHPLFEMAKCIRRLAAPPYLIGALLMLAGYCRAFYRRDERPLPKAFLLYFRNEQLSKLRAIFRSSRPSNCRL